MGFGQQAVAQLLIVQTKIDATSKPISNVKRRVRRKGDSIYEGFCLAGCATVWIGG